MMYKVKIDDYVLPFGATKIETKIKNRNKDVELLNGQVMSLVKSPGLTEWTIETTMPHPDYLLSKLERLKLDKKPFILTIVRDGSFIPNDSEWLYASDGMTSATVTIEDYNRSEDTSVGKRSKIKMTFKEYIAFKTNSVEISTVDNYNVYELVTRLNNNRDIPTEYTVPINKYFPYTWYMVSLKIYGSTVYGNAIRKANIQFENDGSIPYAPIDRCPGKLYPTPGSKLNIDTIKIMNIFVADTGYKADNSVIVESTETSTKPVHEPITVTSPNVGKGTKDDPYVFTLHYGDGLDWMPEWAKDTNDVHVNGKLPGGISLRKRDPNKWFDRLRLYGIVEFGIEVKTYSINLYTDGPLFMPWKNKKTWIELVIVGV